MIDLTNQAGLWNHLVSSYDVVTQNLARAKFGADYSALTHGRQSNLSVRFGVVRFLFSYLISFALIALSDVAEI